jgi:hypothetical protein
LNVEKRKEEDTFPSQEITVVQILQKESCYGGFRQESFSPEQMHWEPSKIKDFDKLLKGLEYYLR